MIAFLKRESGEREGEMVELRRNLREAREEAAVGKDRLSQQFEDTVSALQQQLGERTDEVREMKTGGGREGTCWLGEDRAYCSSPHSSQ